MKSFAASSAYVAAVHDLIPGGAHTYAKGDDQYPDGMAPVIERGQGCRVWDIDGNEFVEFGSGLRSNLLGHGFEPVVRARFAVAGKWCADSCRPHHLELEAAERLTELIPSAEMVKFGLNGSDATPRPRCAWLARIPAVIWWLCAGISRSSPPMTGLSGPPPMSAGIPEAAEQLAVQFGYNDLPGLARLFDAQPGQIAAVILEAETVEPRAGGLLRRPAPPVRPVRRPAHPG